MRKILVPLAMFASLAMSSVAFAKEKLGVGDPAPTIKVAKWIKGTPIESFEKGKVYVVEFWATWCGPCKVSIPHLTELAKKYKGKVSFTGVSVWEEQENKEDDKYFAKVDEFVEKQGEKMDYNVAVDGLDHAMAETWMKAAGQDGIPAAFVIGKDQKVVWVGHPMDKMEQVIDEVLLDKFDSKAFGEKQSKINAEQEKMRAEQQKMQELFAPIMKLSQSGKNKEALAEFDKVVAKNPTYLPRVAMFRHQMLLQVDEKAAHKYALKLSKTIYKDNPQALNQLAWNMVDDKSKFKSPDYKIAVSIAEQAAKASKNEDGMILDTLAYAYYKAGNLKKALTTQEKAVVLLEKMQGVPEDAKAEITDRLKMFKQKAGK